MKVRQWVVVLAAVGAVGAGALSANAQPERLRGGREGSLRDVLRTVVEEAGLDPREVLAELRSGAVLAEIIEEAGGNVQAVIDVVVSNAAERLNAAVENGRITQEQADRLLEELETAVEDAVYAERPVRPIARGLVWLASEETGLLSREIRERMRSGDTLAQILTETGVDVDAFIDEVIDHADARFEQAVENGRITQERADEMLAELREQLPTRLNRTNPL